MSSQLLSQTHSRLSPKYFFRRLKSRQLLTLTTVRRQRRRVKLYPLSSPLFPMLARKSLARLVAQPSPLGAVPQGARNMATLRELELRLKSVRNIEKITKVSNRPRQPNARIVTYCRVIVHENDCLYQARKSTACYAKREAVWYRKLR
jgi:hypothetical protein